MMIHFVKIGGNPLLVDEASIMALNYYDNKVALAFNVGDGCNWNHITIDSADKFYEIIMDRKIQESLRKPDSPV